MSTRPTIDQVIYQWGLVSDPTDWRGLKTMTLEGEELPYQLVDAIFDNNLLGAGGMYGIPEAGDPVEISSLQITHEHGVTALTIYNLGIMLLYSNDDIYPRILRVCSLIQDLAEEQ